MNRLIVSPDESGFRNVLENWLPTQLKANLVTLRRGKALHHNEMLLDANLDLLAWNIYCFQSRSTPKFFASRQLRFRIILRPWSVRRKFWL